MRQESLRSGAIWARPAPAALVALAAALVACGAALALVRARGAAASATGRAEWIWYTSRVPRPAALRFYATREFSLARAPSRASARLFVDREYVLFVNGVRVGSGEQRPGDSLAVRDLTGLLRPGVNRIAIEAASPSGIGGILFALNVDGAVDDAAASGAAWRVDLDAGSIERGGRYRPVVWGPPPQYPWSYPKENP